MLVNATVSSFSVGGTESLESEGKEITQAVRENRKYSHKIQIHRINNIFTVMLQNIYELNNSA